MPRPADPLRDQLDAAHPRLMRVHKALLEHERARYEATRGPVGTPLQFLDVAMNDPSFAWLRPLSELIVQIDECASARGGTDPQLARALLAKAAALLTPSDTGTGFHQAYHRAIAESPTVAAAHANWRQGSPAPEGGEA